MQNLLGKVLVGDGQHQIISIHCLYSFLSENRTFSLADTLLIGYNGSVLVQVYFKSSVSQGKRMEKLTINEVAKLAGMRASAIRYYESVHLLPPPQRSSGRRRYDPDVLRRLSFIQVAQAAGLTIAEIQVLLSEQDEHTPLSERWQALAHQKLIEAEALMRKVQGMKTILANGLKCRCANLEECIDCIVRAETSG